MQGILAGYKQMMCCPMYFHFSLHTWHMQDILSQLTSCIEVYAKQNAEALLSMY